MVLPPVESSPLLLMRFTTKAPPDLIDFVKERLERGGMKVVVRETDDNNDGAIIFGLTTTQKELETEAEAVRLVKPITAGAEAGTDGSDVGGGGGGGGGGSSIRGPIMEYFTVDTRNDFLGYPESVYFDSRRKDDPDEYDSIGLLTASDRVMLVWDMLGSMTVLEHGSISSNLSRKLIAMDCAGEHHRRQLSLRKSLFPKKLSEMKAAESAERLQKKSLCLLLKENDLIDLVSPVHIPHIKKKLFRETWKLHTGPPIRPVRDYYGDEVALYFAWMDHTTRCLVVPGTVGLVIFFFRTRAGDTVDTSPLVPFHGLITFIWSIVFLRSWEREEKRLAYEWGTLASSEYGRRTFNTRPGFIGELRVSPVTGVPEKYYPPHLRWWKYVVNGLITMVLLGFAFLIMILSLNLQGYVQPRDDRERWQSDHDHPFYYPFLAHFAEEGNLFDAASYWRCYIPVILHVCVVMSMNMCYRHIAEKLTEWENHETEVAHENSLILKRFLFEAFDAYIILFYLAFFEKDMGKLRSELVSLFNVDTFRRLLVECALPLALQWMGRVGEKKEKYGEHKKVDGLDFSLSGSDGYKPLTKEATKDLYEEFDDYLEMIIELGYVTLFASAYPLAAFVAIFANFIEIRTDMLKLSQVCLRPRSIRTDSIGTWKLLMSAIIWGSALTNCLIFGFSSKQLYQWLPDLYYIDDFGQHKMVPGKGWIVVFLIFGVERILVFLALFINLVMPTVPSDVRIKEERRQFVRLQLTQKLRVSVEKSGKFQSTSLVLASFLGKGLSSSASSAKKDSSANEDLSAEKD